MYVYDVKCADTTSTVIAYSATSAGLRRNTPMLLSDPAPSLGKTGNVARSSSNTTPAAPAMIRNVTRQPNVSPTTRPSGMPATIAIAVPIASRLSARLFRSLGASRTASGTEIDQNTACARCPAGRSSAPRNSMRRRSRRGSR